MIEVRRPLPGTEVRCTVHCAVASRPAPTRGWLAASPGGPCFLKRLSGCKVAAPPQRPWRGGRRSQRCPSRRGRPWRATLRGREDSAREASGSAAFFVRPTPGYRRVPRNWKLSLVGLKLQHGAPPWPGCFQQPTQSKWPSHAMQRQYPQAYDSGGACSNESGCAPLVRRRGWTRTREPAKDERTAALRRAAGAAAARTGRAVRATIADILLRMISARGGRFLRAPAPALLP